MSSCQNLPLRSPRPAVESEELLLLLPRKRLRLRLLLEDPLLVGLRVEGSHGPVDSTIAEDGGGGRRGGGGEGVAGTEKGEGSSGRGGWDCWKRRRVSRWRSSVASAVRSDVGGGVGGGAGRSTHPSSLG